MARVQYDDIFVCSIKTTCWKQGEGIENKEVIEFGGCLLNVKSLRVSEEVNLLVKPTKEISDYCLSKTGISQDDAKHGVTFPDLIQYINEVYGVENKPWASYGSFTKKILEKQCQKNDIAFLFSERFINIKTLFPIIYNLKQEVSSREAMRRLCLDIPKGRDSLDDVLNASIIFKETLRGSIPCLTKTMKSSKQKSRKSFRNF